MAATEGSDLAGNRGGHGPSPTTPQWELQLLGAWSLSCAGIPISLRGREQRLLAALALHGGRPRQYVAGLLWPESTENHAAGNLRAAVWKIDRTAPGLLIHDRTQIQLAAGVSVDVTLVVDAARDLFALRERRLDDVDHLGLLRTLLREELLPGWYDDWLMLERTRLQDLRQQALEQLADLLSERGDTVAALQAAQAAVAIEPLRESAHRSLITVQIRAGNHSDALRAYTEFRSRIRSELGVTPSAQLESLVRPLVASTPRGNGRDSAFARAAVGRRH